MTVTELLETLEEIDNGDCCPVVVSCDQLTACEPFDLGRVVGVEIIDGMAVLQVANPEDETE